LISPKGCSSLFSSPPCPIAIFPSRTFQLFQSGEGPLTALFPCRLQVFPKTNFLFLSPPYVLFSSLPPPRSNFDKSSRPFPCPLWSCTVSFFDFSLPSLLKCPCFFLGRIALPFFFTARSVPPCHTLHRHTVELKLLRSYFFSFYPSTPRFCEVTLMIFSATCATFRAFFSRLRVKSLRPLDNSPPWASPLFFLKLLLKPFTGTPCFVG